VDGELDGHARPDAQNWRLELSIPFSTGDESEIE
jgi:hypothetical protein